MKHFLIELYELIVGPPLGFCAEGNSQWYYFSALVINGMLTWWLHPELGVLFTVFSVLHFALLAAYGFMDMADPGHYKASVVYFVISLGMLVTGLVLDWAWTLITSAVMVFAMLLAPNEMGNNILMREPKDYLVYYGNRNYWGLMLCQTCWFACLVAVAVLIPVPFWVKLLIIVACMALHPVMDFLEGECISAAGITMDAFDNLLGLIKGEKPSQAAIEEQQGKAPVVAEQDEAKIE